MECVLNYVSSQRIYFPEKIFQAEGKIFWVLTSPSISQAFYIFVLEYFVYAVEQAKRRQLSIAKGEWKQLFAHHAIVTLKSISLSLPGLQTRVVLVCS